MPKTPSWLSNDAAEHFGWVMPLLIADEVVCKLDIPVVCMACEAFAKFLNAEKFSDQKAAALLYERLMSSFGVTFKAREQLDLAKQRTRAGANDSPDAFEGLFE